MSLVQALQVEEEIMENDRRRRQSLQLAAAFHGELLGISSGVSPQVAQGLDSNNDTRQPSINHEGVCRGVLFFLSLVLHILMD